MTILENINCHDDLLALNDEQRQQLCAELREFMVNHISRTGGHLASNLGVVELTVAIETVYDTRVDRLVFDVGHQSYIHKLLTGRQTDFSHLRQFGGIAGFPKPCESDTDAFVAGHASSSVSVGLGMARARSLQQQDYDVVCVLGDGAATGGMAFEGLNDAADSGERMVVILNDNEMSIDRNVGGLARHLSRLRTKDHYLGMKEWYRGVLQKLPGGKGIYRFTRGVKDWVKRVVLPETIFEHMGLTYLGPVDGHDLPELIRVLRAAKELNRPVLVHVLTQKGHGYKFAEEQPSKFHGVGVFDPDSGEVAGKGKVTFSDVFGCTLTDLAEKNPRICTITAAMPGGTGLMGFKQAYPDRLFDVGIAEEHAVSMAGGLAKQGMVPVVAIYSTFLQRSYDQLMQDICIQKLHAVFAVDRAGLVGEDGETHHGVFDVGFLRQMPGMLLLAPASCKELSQMLAWAVTQENGPVAIRYPRGGDRGYTDCAWPSKMSVHKDGSDVTLVTYGTLVCNVIDAAELLEKQGISARVIRLTQLSPISYEELAALSAGKVVVVEEAMHGSGIGTCIAAHFGQQGKTVSVLDLGSHFVTHGSLEELYHAHGLDAVGIQKFVSEVFRNEN